MPSQEEALVTLFFKVMKHSSQFSAQRHGEHSPLMLGQARCIRILSLDGPISQRALAERLGIRAPSLSELLSKLEASGHVRRLPSAEDKRTYLVELTAAGAALAAEQQQVRNRLYQEMLAPLSEEEQAQFGSILHKIDQHFTALEGRTHE